MLRVERQGGVVTVRSDDLEVHGRGAYVTAAIEDFQRMAASMYLSLRAEQARTDSDTERRWDLARRWIEERQ